MLDNYTLDMFSPLVGQQFIMRVDPSTGLELELAEATPLGTAGPSTASPGRQPFSLVFRGPPTPVGIQRTYQVEHVTLGTFELFLVPIGPDQRGMLYQAIFT